MEVCPNSGEPSTPYEHGAVKRLIAFGIQVIQNGKGDNDDTFSAS